MYSSPPYTKSREVNSKDSQHRRSVSPSWVENQWRVNQNGNPKDLNDKEPEDSRTTQSLTQINLTQTTPVGNHIMSTEEIMETAAEIIATTSTQTPRASPLILNPSMLHSPPADNSILFLNQK